jgi:hypothetical protein
VVACCTFRSLRPLAETAWVDSRYAILHHMTMVLGQPNKYYLKQTHGIETFEAHFNEPQFLQLLG